MLLNDYIRWGNIPEYVLGNLWHIDINNGPSPSPLHKMYFTDVMLDNSISEISFSQESLDFTKNSFGFPNINGIQEFDAVSITYYDYTKSPFSTIATSQSKFPITRFFQDWMDTLYDKEKQCVTNGWRGHSKDIKVTLARYHNKGPLTTLAAGAINQGISAADSVLTKPLGVDLGVNLPKVNFDVEQQNIVTYDLQNCYVSKLGEISLDDDSGDRKPFTVELICERVIPNFSV